MKKIDIGTICAFILTAYSATIAVLFMLGNDVMFNIFWPMSGVLLGIGGIIVACNAREGGLDEKICIVLTIIGSISTTVCGLNLMACVMCLPWSLM